MKLIQLIKSPIFQAFLRICFPLVINLVYISVPKILEQFISCWSIQPHPTWPHPEKACPGLAQVVQVARVARVARAVTVAGPTIEAIEEKTPMSSVARTRTERSGVQVRSVNPSQKKTKNTFPWPGRRSSTLQFLTCVSTHLT